MHSTDRNPAGGTEPVLRIENLDVHYGRAHALQGVSLAVGEGVLAVVGRNGMGKSTLCKAITGLVPARGSVRFAGRELLGLQPDVITRAGVAYVPQGRRVWRSLTVDETLRLAAGTARRGAWTVERVYSVFPRLAERRANGGAQLSGGEQQMLAIGRALLFNPSLLVMDEPTEGLAPVIVEQVATLLKALTRDRSMSVLLVEQNLGVALEVADDVAVMVNGRIAHRVPAAELAADRALQQRLLGLKAGAADASGDRDDAGGDGAAEPTATIFRVVRAHSPSVFDLPEGPEESGTSAPAPIAVRPPTGATHPDHEAADLPATGKAAYLVGAWNEQPGELRQAKACLERSGLRVVTVELAGALSPAQVSLRELLRHHPDAGLFSRFAGGRLEQDDTAAALAGYLASRRDLGGLLVLTRERTASVALAAADVVPPHLPRLVVGEQPMRAAAGVLAMTVPAGGGAASERQLALAAHALAGMFRAPPSGADTQKGDAPWSAPSRPTFPELSRTTS
jgi:ABC-type branched-subunit amino acid transport system ATPase component